MKFSDAPFCPNNREKFHPLQYWGFIVSTPLTSETDHNCSKTVNKFWSSTFEVEDVESVPIHKNLCVCFFYLVFWEPIITLETKLTMALAGCSGSCSANRWHTFSVLLPLFLAIKPKILLHTHTHTRTTMNKCTHMYKEHVYPNTQLALLQNWDWDWLKEGLTLQLCSRLVSICEQISREVRTTHKNPTKK